MKSFFPVTLSWYLVRHYVLNFIFLLACLLGVIYLFDTVELLRRAAKFDNVSLGLVLQMGFYKLLEVGQLIFPFAILFSGILTFWQLNRRHELMVMRSSGMSVWQFVTPVVIVALCIGIISVTLINPLGALLVSKYDSLENEYLERQNSLVTLSEQGLWLRQEYDGGTAILHSGHIKMPEWVLDKVMVFFFSPENDFVRRIDSETAQLESGQWNFNNAVINKPKNLPQKADFLTMATTLTKDELENSFSKPETISFWRLPTFIKILEETGFDSTSLRIHFQNLLAQPLLFMAMIILAASVSLRPPRLRGAAILIVSGVLIGFTIFMASSFLQALGASQQIPIIVAAWFPAIISFLSGIAVLMTLEDG